MKRLLTGAIAALLVFTAAAPTAKPLPSFSATGSMTAKAEFQGKAVTMQTDMRVMHRNTLTRVDILKIAASSDDPNGSAMMAAFLPKGTVSAVVNQTTNMLTIWSSTRTLFYQSKLAVPKAVKSATSTSTSAPLDNALKALNSMTQFDVMKQSFELTGHQTVNGRMSSVFRFTSQTQKHGGKPQEIVADIALADDLSGIPVHLLVDAKGDATGNVLIDLSSVSTTPPDAKLFTPPAGYRKTANLFDVFGPATGAK